MTIQELDQREPGPGDREEPPVDTVETAAATPEDDQPYAELGLRDDEYHRIRGILERRPTQSELAMYSIMWSEHCSYKSSKVHLRQFGDIPKGERMLVGMGENAGVVDVGRRRGVLDGVEQGRGLDVAHAVAALSRVCLMIEVKKPRPSRLGP